MARSGFFPYRARIPQNTLRAATPISIFESSLILEAPFLFYDRDRDCFLYIGTRIFQVWSANNSSENNSREDAKRGSCRKSPGKVVIHVPGSLLEIWFFQGLVKMSDVFLRKKEFGCFSAMLASTCQSPSLRFLYWPGASYRHLLPPVTCRTANTRINGEPLQAVRVVVLWLLLEKCQGPSLQRVEVSSGFLTGRFFPC